MHYTSRSKQMITDAQIINDNNTNCDSTATANPAQSIIAQSESPLNDSNCNTTNDFQQAPKSNLITLQISFNRTTQKAAEDNVLNCDEDPKVATDECLEQLAKTNEIPNSDTVLKYVYKADDKSFVQEKSTPHPLNSLRKKRSVNKDINIEKVAADESKSAPLIVDYETRHSPENSEESPLAGKLVKNEALADFNTETLHNTKKPVIDKENSKESSSSQSSEEKDEKENKVRSNSEESLERSSENSSEKKRSNIKNDKYSKNERNTKYNDGEKYEPSESRENYDSREKERYPAYNTRSSKDKLRQQGSFEQYEEKDNRRPYDSRQSHTTRKSIDESNESGEKDSREDTLPRGEIKNNREKINSLEEDKSSYKDIRENSKQKDYNDNEKARYSEESGEISSERKAQKHTKRIHENSSESEEGIHPRSRVYDSKSPEKNNSTHNPPAIQDVDLGDFSFERIQVDDKGKVVTAGENEETSHPVKSSLNSETHLPQSSEQISSSEESVEPINAKYENNKEPVHINDGEIKPVVEINSDSNESPVPENISEDLKNDSVKDESLESLLGTKEDLEQKNEEITSDKAQNDKSDVKQEFERIPVNYKHKNENEDSSEQKVNNNKDEIISETTPPETPPNEESLDVLKPINVNYDEHLKFKFDDVGIKLPEIKLPDVLDYDYEEPSYLKKSDTQKESDAYHHYDNEQTKKKKKADDNEDEHDDAHYYGYYGNDKEKQNYKKKNDNRQDDDEDQEDEEDHEDLYERFVRERFGKRGSFQERSGQLRDARIKPNDGKLYDNVKNILKKTENIQKQAEKSGDPNAGYAWTLEYGENL